MNGPSQSTRFGVVLRGCVQGKTLYMSEQSGVDGKLYVEELS